MTDAIEDGKSPEQGGLLEKTRSKVAKGTEEEGFFRSASVGART